MNRSLLVAAFVAVGLTACGEKPKPAPPPAPTPPAKQAPKITPAPADSPAPAPAPAPSSGMAPAPSSDMAPGAMKAGPAKDSGAGMTPPDMAPKGENMAMDPPKGSMNKEMMKK